jgi:hypothetical protein
MLGHGDLGHLIAFGQAFSRTCPRFSSDQAGRSQNGLTKAPQRSTVVQLSDKLVPFHCNRGVTPRHSLA